MTARGNSRLTRAWNKQTARGSGRQLDKLNEAKALIRDAERYRWSREHPQILLEHTSGSITPEQYDAIVDELRGETDNVDDRSSAV